MPIPFKCPYCGLETSVAEEYAGRTGPCARCGKEITVPALAGPPGLPPPKSGVGVGAIVAVVVVALLGLLFCAGVPMLFWMRAGVRPVPATVVKQSAQPGCSNNLKQIGLALHNYHDVYQCFPPAVVTDKQGKSMHSWRVAILPYLGQEGLYRQYDHKEPWNSEKNRQLAAMTPPVYRCPQANLPQQAGMTNYVMITGEGAVGGKPNEGTPLAQITDGTSNTIAVVEVTNPVPWMEPRDLKFDELSWRFNDGTGKGPSSTHLSGGAHVLFCDGSVHFLLGHIDPETLRRLILRSDGLPVDVSPFEGPTE